MAKRIDHERIYHVHTNICTVKTQQETKSSKHLGWIIKINATKKNKKHHTYMPHAPPTQYTHLQWAIIQWSNFPDNTFRRGH